ncbi:hypothetical protein W97_04502 [Coniosporium apollinis CBS 100218]|uniref:C4-dicarboxylate transporter/malic acid transporter n=1 Tax=Coniosporium apollinis (strain CBS 100218) TaxID=1168221 RepID=R7YTX0_CONA1|nr:uncharacterized protein W97_04502 [Coniosporium apollinis CBS 100218]EON65264.1 hypothetical protein W97_04502 [Coniosporium apollinis CBS 100218]
MADEGQDLEQKRSQSLADYGRDAWVGSELRLKLKERVRHFTWTWFTMTMATGGIANVLSSVPYRFNGIYGIGCAFFLLNIVLFIFNVLMISTRFYLYPSTFKSSFLHPTESLFIPAAVISFGTVMINVVQYGVGDRTGLWLENTMVVMYWIYCALAMLFSCGIYLIIWSTQTFTISRMTPVWIFPAYPLLLVGPYAGNLCPHVSPENAIQVIVSGFILQGVGFMVALMVYAAFIYRLMTQKLPTESLRPGMFISVGPSGFTTASIIAMAQTLPKVIPEGFMGNGRLAGEVSAVMANWWGIWLWGLALWFFLVSLGAHYSCVSDRRMDFAMSWYSFIFPNTALITATFAVATALQGNTGFRVLGCILTVLLIATWGWVFGMMVRAVVLKQILWPEMQEDRDEGGWKRVAIEAQRREGRGKGRRRGRGQAQLD